MSLFRRRQRREALSNVAGPPPRNPDRAGVVAVTNDSALRHSAVWACLRLRADLISTFPLDVYRLVGGVQVEVPKPPVLVTPGGVEWDLCDWMYASQFDLDRAGNAIGLITETNALGLPARIDLQPINVCSAIQRRDEATLRYRIDGKEYPAEKVWHERQYRVAGLPVGLSPVAYAAWSIGEYLSMQDFALKWFGNGGVPKARLRNREKVILPAEAEKISARYQATVEHGGVFVHGADWEYDFMQAESSGMEWLEGKRYGLGEIARFFGTPADLIEAAISAPGSITYQSGLQRNLQFLVMNLQPAVYRREKNLSKLLAKPRYVKLNTNALLRMDPETQIKVIAERIRVRTLTVSEARALYDQPPLTPEQEAEFNRLFPPKQPKQGVSALSDWLDDDAAPRSPVPYDLQAMS